MNLQQYKSLKGVKVLALNVRSLINKWDSFDFDLLDNEIDWNWLNTTIPNALVNSNLYQLFGHDRSFLGSNGKVKIGAGLCSYVKNSHNVNTHAYAHLNNSTIDLELQCLQLQIGDNKSLAILNVYRPPTGNVKSAMNILNNALELLNAVRRLDIIYNLSWWF